MAIMGGKVVQSLILVALMAGGWGFMQSRVAILGRTLEARQRSQRNAVLLGGMTAILLAEFWAPSARGVFAPLAIVVIAAYFGLTMRHTQHNRSKARVDRDT
jgi:hypothetical protein